MTTEDKQEQPASNEQTEAQESPIALGFSDEEIAKLAKGETKAVPAENADDDNTAEEEGAEEVAEGEEENENQDVGEQEEAEEEGKKKKGKRHFVPAERIKEEAEKHAGRQKELEATLEIERQKNAKMSGLLEKLLSAQEKEVTEDDVDEEDIVDEKAYKKVNQRVDKIEQQAIVKDFKREMDMADSRLAEKYGPEYKQAGEFLIAVEASKIIANHEARGKKIVPEAAVLEARKALVPEYFEIYQSQGSIEDYTYHRAKMLGFNPKKAEAKKSGDKTKVNMKALDEARKSAGAPTYQRESVIVKGANWHDELAAKGKTKFTDKYLQSQGL